MKKRLIILLLVLSCLGFRHDSKRTNFGMGFGSAGSGSGIDYDGAWGAQYTSSWGGNYEAEWL